MAKQIEIFGAFTDDFLLTLLNQVVARQVVFDFANALEHAVGDVVDADSDIDAV